MIRIINQKAEIITTEQEFERGLEMCVRAGSVSHKSNPSDYVAFMEKWQHHDTLWEFGDMQVLFTCSRAIADELRTHRLTSCVMESTRYNKYEDDLEVVIYNMDIYNTPLLNHIDEEYKNYLHRNVAAEDARDYLPLMKSTKLWMKANFREWRHIFKVRYLNKYAHPAIRWLVSEVWANTPDWLKIGLNT